MDERRRRPYLVFVSHASDDTWIARRMAEVIERKGRRYGVVAFLDARDLESGDRFSDALRDKIRDAEELIVLLSSASIGRDWVRHEVGAAWGLGKRIVGILDKLAHDRLPAGLVKRRCMGSTSSIGSPPKSRAERREGREGQ